LTLARAKLVAKISVFLGCAVKVIAH
jgi:hypothetical protein